jgi:formylglycine-generating enzyme required for sulfatase activity
VALALALVAAPASGSQRATRRQVERTLKHESEMVLVPAGTFVMGADANELLDFAQACEREFGEELAPLACVPERTHDFDTGTSPRQVFLSAFEIDHLEVTTAQYRECVAQDPATCARSSPATPATRSTRGPW